MPNLYYHADAHVCMSLTEGLNNPSLEAGAMGIPLISTRCGAAEEIIKDGENGFLIDRDVNSFLQVDLQGAEELHLEDGYNYIAVNGENFVDRIKYYLDRPVELQKIVDNAKDTFAQYHHIEARAKDFVGLLEGIL